MRFLAGVYNGGDYPFDLTDLRALDAELVNACIDYLNYDRLAKAEVHTHLPEGGQQMQWFLTQHGIRPQPHLSTASRGYPHFKRRENPMVSRLRAPETIMGGYDGGSAVSSPRAGLSSSRGTTAHLMINGASYSAGR